MNEKATATIEIGKPVPRRIRPDGGWPGEGARLSIKADGNLQLMAYYRKPTPAEILCFRRLRAYGIYKSPEYPYGMLLWDMGRRPDFETPFSPEVERKAGPHEMETFLTKTGVVSCTRFLVDERWNVRAGGMTGLHPEAVTELKSIWADPAIDWDGYDAALEALWNAKTIKELWREATKWEIEQHRTFGEGHQLEQEMLDRFLEGGGTVLVEI